MTCGGNVKMVHGSRYRVHLRRRREQKTDYQARKGFIVSGKPRLVARSSLKNTVAQIIVAKPHGDEVLASAHTGELVKNYSWKAATGNLPAAYLTGLLCGLKAKKKGVSEAILDLGLVAPSKGSKVFTVLSGVVDAGVAIPHSPEKILKDRAAGFHIQEYAESLGAQEEYKPKFSTYLANGLKPEKVNDHFVEVRNSILTAFNMPIPKTEPRPIKPKKPEPKPKPVKVEKPEAKPIQKVEAKKAEVVEVKSTVAPQITPEVKAPTEAKAKPKVEAEAEVKAKPKAARVLKAKSAVTKRAAVKAKPAAKKTTTAKTKAEKAEEEAKPEAKPKRSTRKKPEAGEASPKPTKKTGGKKA
jgi:large subunit ribosomal protein L18